jgi:hypothetical protein
MDDLAQLKKKVEEKKASLQKQEALIKMRERKNRTRHLIEVGGLVQKAKLDHLPSDIMMGALLSLRKQIDDVADVVGLWQQAGEDFFKKQNKDKIPVILKMKQKPDMTIRQKIRAHGLKWNALRKEWYGYVEDKERAEKDLKGLAFSTHSPNSKD